MSEEKKVLKLQLIKTDKNCYIKKIGWYQHNVDSLIFDGHKPVKTLSSDWLEVRKEPESIFRPVPDEKVNHRMVLKSEFLSGAGFSGHTLGNMRPEIPRDECMHYSDCEWIWNKEFQHLSSLYELKSDTVKKGPVAIEFECELFCEIPDLDGYSGMKWEVVGNNGYCITERNIKHRAIDSILYPEIMLQSCTSIISSDDLYKIVRFHIKQNIDQRYASITSDYDFCLTVKKGILEHEDYKLIRKKESNKRPARNSKRTECTIFEATPASRKYEGYTVLPRIQADTAKKLKRKIDKYLRELMTFINEPIVVCEHCNGMGVQNAVKKFNHEGENK